MSQKSVLKLTDFFGEVILCSLFDTDSMLSEDGISGQHHNLQKPASKKTRYIPLV